MRGRAGSLVAEQRGRPGAGQLGQPLPTGQLDRAGRQEADAVVRREQQLFKLGQARVGVDDQVLVVGQPGRDALDQPAQAQQPVVEAREQVAGAGVLELLEGDPRVAGDKAGRDGPPTKTTRVAGRARAARP